MKKYLHKPTTISIVIFSIILFSFLCVHVLFHFIGNVRDVLGEQFTDVLKLMHFFASSLLCVIFLYFVSFISLCVEKTVRIFKESLQTKIFRAFQILNALWGAVILIFSIRVLPFILLENLSDSIVVMLKDSLYFRYVSSEDVEMVAGYWTLLFWIWCFSYGVITLFVSARNDKHVKTINRIIQEQNRKLQLNAYLGYNYELCTFFQQVKIPYDELNQENGSLGEFLAYHSMVSNGLIEGKYYFNREIPKADGLFTEVDLLYVHQQGIIVIENKHYSTRVFGKATDYDLTIIDRNGKKQSIYNPIKQNENHVMAMIDYLKSEGLYVDEKTMPMYSVVVFTSDNNDNTDDIISGIDLYGCHSFVCTNRNLPIVVRKLLDSKEAAAKVNVNQIGDIMSSLKIRYKAE